MREYGHLSVITDEDGNIVATARKQDADSIGRLPELVTASLEVFEELQKRYPSWTPDSTMGRLAEALQRIKNFKTSGTTS